MVDSSKGENRSERLCEIRLQQLEKNNDSTAEQRTQNGRRKMMSKGTLP